MLDLIGKIRALILKLAGALDWLPATLARLCATAILRPGAGEG